MIFINFLLIAHFIYHSLRWLYLWQLKEYRLDRLMSFFRLPQSGKLFLLGNFWPGEFRRPRLTLKIVLSLLILFTLLYFAATNLSLLLLSDLFLPLITALILLILSVPASLIHQLLIFLAQRKLTKFPGLITIGITGSFGKTSLKDAIAAVLSVKYRVLKTAGTQNTLIAITQTVLRQLQPDHQIFVVEMGAYRRGEIAQICRLVKPQIGIITGINQQHLDLFGSLKNTHQAKFELIDSLPRKGLAVFNLDNPGSRELYDKTRQPKAGYHGLSQEAAAVLAKHFHIPQRQVLTALQSVKPTRLTQSQIKNMTVLDDSYNSNPEGFRFALTQLAKLPGKKLVITPGIIELGPASESIHRQLGDLIGRIPADVLLTSSDWIQPVTAGIANRSQIITIDFLYQHQANYQAVLLEGRLPPTILNFFTNE